MLTQNSNKSKKYLCTCSKCLKNDIEQGIGMLIPKSTRTRHRKKEKNEDYSLNLSSSSSSELVSSFSLSDVDSSSESEIFQLVEPSSSNIILYRNSENIDDTVNKNQMNMVNSDSGNECTSDSNMDDGDWMS